MEKTLSLIRNVSLLTVAVTYRCNSRCRHCQIPHPDSSGKVSVALFSSLVERLLQNSLAIVCLWGGEPLLEAETTVEMLQICKEKGLITEAISNGFWGASRNGAYEMAEQLASSGLSHLHISMDPFHQEWIPLEAVRAALISAVEVGIPHVYWVGKYLEGPGGQSLHDRMMDEMAQKMDIPGVERSPFTRWVQPVGRSARDQEILEKIPFRGGDTGRCPTMPPFGRLGIDPDGNLICCDGTVLTSVERFLKDGLDLQYNIPVNILLEEGPAGLARLAGLPDDDDQKFRNQCHLCYEARTKLRDQYPEYLAPGCFY